MVLMQSYDLLHDIQWPALASVSSTLDARKLQLVNLHLVQTLKCSQEAVILRCCLHFTRATKILRGT